MHCKTVAAGCGFQVHSAQHHRKTSSRSTSTCADRSVCEATFDDDNNWAKHLLAPDAHAPCHAGDHSGRVELPAAVVCQLTTDKHLAGGRGGVQYSLVTPTCKHSNRGTGPAALVLAAD